MTLVDAGVLTLVGDCDEGPSVCGKDDDITSVEVRLFVLDIECVDDVTSVDKGEFTVVGDCSVEDLPV